MKRTLLISTCLLLCTISLYAQTLYCTTFSDSHKGTINKFTPSTNHLTVEKYFNYDLEDGPSGSLILAKDGKLYGVTTNWQLNDNGAIFSFNPPTSSYKKLHDFTKISGLNCKGLLQAKDGKLYGMTAYGGSMNYGVIFSFDLSSSTYRKLKDFDGFDGAYTNGGFIQANDGKLYGMSQHGGRSDLGVIFSFDPSTSTYTRLKDFDGNNGSLPFGNLIQGKNGKLYGMTNRGGSEDLGVIFSFDPSSSSFKKLKDLNFTIGGVPYGSLIQASDGKLYGLTSQAFGGNGTIFSFDPSSSTLTKLKDFDGLDGAFPMGSLNEASDRKLYGVTSIGGSKRLGTIFSYDPSTSTFSNLKEFDGTNGSSPLWRVGFVEIDDSILKGAPTISLTTPTDSSTYLTGTPIKFSAVASDTNGSISKVDFYHSDTLIGTVTQAPYSLTWNNAPAGNYTIIAKATDNDSFTATSEAVRITVKSIAPTISIISPETNSTYSAVATITIRATASDSDGVITKVDFYMNGFYQTTVTKSPYTFTLTTPAGNYSFTAKATDNSSLVTTSNTVDVSVYSTKNPPSVTMLYPSPNASFSTPASINIAAMAVNGNGGRVAKVDFYQNNTLLATVTHASGDDPTRPYIFIWNNPPGGKYSIIAKATDSDSLVIISNPVEISVSNPKVTPSVSLTSPAANSSFTAPASITITANTSDTDSSISKVDFYSNDTLIGSSTERPYRFTWNNVPGGNYSILAKATAYNNTLVITSDAVDVSVSNPTAVPFLSITSPAAIDTFAAPASITITASIRDTNTSIRKIDFYSNDSLLATVTKRPYTFIWKNVAAGIYFITAKATINDTLIITSHASETTVFNATSQTKIPPFVSITSPKASATFTAPASISISANASDTDGSITKVDFYSNDTLIGTANQIPYSFTWSNVGAGNYTITAKATDNNGLMTISDAVEISFSNPKLAPHVSLTSPVSNATFTAPASITISANAGDNDGSISKVDFYSNDTLIGTATHSPYTFTWSNVPAGNHSITAKATDNDEANTISETIRISVFNPKLAPHVSLTSPVSNASFTAPASITISANAGDDDGSISKVDFYSNDTLIGTATQSPYSFTWTNVPAGNYSITAKATDNDQIASPSDIIEISVAQPSVNPGFAPSVSLASPIANSAFAAPASVTITANADDADGYISRVDFYNNDTLIGTSTESPYTFTWQNVPVGNYSITAKASDNDLLVTSSDTVHITVYKAKVAPLVSITSPAAGKTFPEYSTISITANAMDTDGSITKVDFYNNDTLIGTATESPYTFALNNVKAGDCSLTAKATDNDSLVTSSETVHVSVLPNKPPVVTITSPGANETFTSAETITLKAAASDPDGKIAKVEFYNGATLLKTITQYPYAFEWEDIAAGSYKITATATDNFGLKTTSEPVSVIVEAKDSIIVKCAPNPATNTMTISTVGFDQNKPLYVSVIASGIVVKMIEVTNLSQTIQLDVSSLVSGIYTIKLTCGDKVVSKQFLKL